MGFAAYFVGAITFTTPAGSYPPLFLFLNLQTNSPKATAFRNIGWKMYLVYIFCNVVSTILIYFFIPETARLSLEEVGELFGDRVVVHLTNDGHGLVEGDKIAEVGEAIRHEGIEGEKLPAQQIENV
jgi:hypothetical protein